MSSHTLSVSIVSLWIGSLVSFAYSMEPQGEWKAPPEAASRANPVKADDASIQAGGKVFKRSCASCHGANGRGDGFATKFLKRKPDNLAEILSRDSDGTLFWKVRTGNDVMPSNEALSETDTWHVVNFMRTLDKPARASGKGAGKPTIKGKPKFHDWPNFRGPNHDGISCDPAIKSTWKSPPKLVWERRIGSAFSSFACVGDRVYTCGTEEDRQVLVCLEAATGKTIWKRPFEKQFHDRHSQAGDGTRATPTVSDGLVYILGGHGTLLCVDAANGTEVWRKTLNHPPHWGYSGSVLVEDDLAIVVAGGSDGALVAFDKKTGKPKWKTGDNPAGYASPYPFTFAGTRYIVGLTGDAALIVEARTGRKVLQLPWKTDWKVNAAAPIFHDGYLFISSGYGYGCGLYKLASTGTTLSSEEIWKSKVIRNKFQSCILHDGYLYTSDEKAFQCVEFLTGETKWTVQRAKHGTMFLVGNSLVYLSQEGQLRIGEASPKGFKPVLDVEVFGDGGFCWTIPVLHHGRLYARNLEKVICLDIR